MSRLLAAAVLLSTGFPSLAGVPSVLISRKFPNAAARYSVQTDGAGNIYLGGAALSSGFPLVNPIQSTGSIFVAKLDPAGMNILYSTFLGSVPTDSFGGMAVDPAGNVYIAGSTTATNFPTTPNAVQRTDPGPAGQTHAFVIKIDPTGQQVLYSTYLGGKGGEIAYSIAVDPTGAAYIAGVTGSSDFPVTPGGNLAPSTNASLFITKLAPDGSFFLYSAVVEPEPLLVYRISLAVTNLTEAAVFVNDGTAPHILKLNAAGDRIVYRTDMPPGAGVTSIASDPDGFIWAAGSTNASGLATPDAVQMQPNGNSYFRSEDGGATWTAGAEGLDAGVTNQVIAAGGSVYACTDRGLFRSDDRGLHWTRLLSDGVFQVAVDPSAAGTLYVTRSGVTQFAKSTDGGVTWIDIDPKVQPDRIPLMSLAIDPTNPSTIYAGGSRVYRSGDGGLTWTASDSLSNSGVNSLTVDPTNASIVYASMLPNYAGCGIAPCIPVSSGLMRSIDGGRTFQGSSVNNFAFGIAIDPAHPGTAYAGGVEINKTLDFGAHWLTVRLPFFFLAGTSLSVSLDSSGALLVQTADGRLFRSTDGGSTFSQISSAVFYGTRSFAVADGVIHVGAQRGANAFVAKLDLSGNIAYATYWGGRISETASAIAVDADGAVYVAGSTVSPDFPERNEVGEYAGNQDAFVVKFDPDGGVIYSTTWGGSDNDQASAIAAGPGGKVFVAGLTASADFPGAAGQIGGLFLVGLQ